MHLFASFEVDHIDGTRFGFYEVAITTDISEATVSLSETSFWSQFRPHEQRR